LIWIVLLALSRCAWRTGYQYPQETGGCTQSQRESALAIGLLNGPTFNQGFAGSPIKTAAIGEETNGIAVHRSVKLFPGVRLNMSKSGPSVSVGFKGFHENFGPHGRRTTVSLPATGLSYVTTHHAHHHHQYPRRYTVKARHFCEPDSVPHLIAVVKDTGYDEVVAKVPVVVPAVPELAN
jgi:Protein of unknown function (DUF4236)